MIDPSIYLSSGPFFTLISHPFLPSFSIFLLQLSFGSFFAALNTVYNFFLIGKTAKVLSFLVLP